MGWIRFLLCVGSMTTIAPKLRRVFDGSPRFSTPASGYPSFRLASIGRSSKGDANRGVLELGGRITALARDRERISPTECVGIPLRGGHPAFE
jgi:hypothetical protein